MDGSKRLSSSSRCEKKGGLGMNRPVIIAMDFENRQEAERFLTSFSGESLFLKVGMELFYKEGPSLVRDWKREGHRIFLDLKLHDIPNKVKRAARQLAT